MKKHILVLFLAFSMLLTACQIPLLSKPTETAEPPTVTLHPTITQTPTETPLPPGVLPTRQPSRTPSAKATCPETDDSLQAQFASAFKGKNHDARQLVLDFLNAGGSPQLAITKLVDYGVTASRLDVTGDGVSEFFLPSSFYSIFGCKNGKYETLLDVAPSEGSGSEAVPLAIRDLNRDGAPEIFIGQVLDYRVKYSLLEWDGANLTPITVENAGDDSKHVYIDNYNIFAVGENHQAQGKITGNWQITDKNGDGLLEISVKTGAGTDFSSSNLDERMTLAWNGKVYALANDSIAANPIFTPKPTATSLPFSATCNYKTAGLVYDQSWGEKGTPESIENFLNAGGDPEKLRASFVALSIRDFTNDSLKDILLTNAHSVYIFTCVNGKFQQMLDLPFDTTPFTLGVMSVQDINKNNLPEIFVKDLACITTNADTCGVLYAVEWDGTKFAPLIEDQTASYVLTKNRRSVNLQDIDKDGIPELVWVSGIPDPKADQSGLPWRLETHTYKWDGKHYIAKLVEYSAPVYLFQVVQDGDHYALDGQYDRALMSYRQVLESKNLSWWSRARQDYFLAQVGLGPCAVKDACAIPEIDPTEKHILQAYTSYRIMLTQFMLGQPDQAEATYNKLLVDYKTQTDVSAVFDMTNDFWQEYQASKNIGSACAKAIAFAASTQKPMLSYIGSSYHGAQMQIYTAQDICPFK